jgi:hypothetical protein
MIETTYNRWYSKVAGIREEKCIKSFYLNPDRKRTHRKSFHRREVVI